MNHLAAELEQALAAAEAPSAPEAAPFRRDAPRALIEPASGAILLRMACEEWAAVFACWAALGLGPKALYPAMALVLAGRFHAFGVILHDAAHMPLRRKTAAIRAVEILCGYPIATTLNAMRYHHLRHHRDSGMASDPYHKPGRHGTFWWTANTLRGLLLVPFWMVRGVFGAAASLVPALRRPYARIFLQDRSRDDLRSSAEVGDCARAEWGQVAAHALLIAAAIRYSAALAWGYALPVSLAGLLAARRVLIEHTHADAPDRRPETILATTRDNHLGILGRLVLAPRNIGYHIVHHLHPQAGLGALPGLRAWYHARYGQRYPSGDGRPR